MTSIRQHLPASLLPLVLLTACIADPAPDPDEASVPLAQLLDCLRETGSSMLAAHRGGPAPGYPENSLSGLERLAELGVLYAEIDVRRSADGAFYLLHDDTLDRTTTGTGPVSGLSWDELRDLGLRDPQGEPTADRLPQLAEAVDIARRHGLILQLDLKDIAPETITIRIHELSARDHVQVIAYTVDQAARLHALDPGLVLSVPDQPEALTDAGVNLNHAYVWLGVGRPDASRDAALAEHHIETSAGLFGLETGDPALYRDTARAGIEIIAVDDVDTAALALELDQLRARADSCRAAVQLE